MRHNTPYGTWLSPVSAENTAAAGGGPQWVDTAGEAVCWAETRPDEGGRVTLLRANRNSPGEPAEELLPAPWNARNRLHEYGGKPWTFVDGQLVFTNWDDQRVYSRNLETGTFSALTREPQQPQGVRYGDLRHGTTGYVWAVREVSTGDRRTDVVRDLVSIPLSGGDVLPLAASHHFLTAPQLSPDGRHAAWIGWNHPAMPWDGTELCVAEVDDQGRFGQHQVLAGGEKVAVCQLTWDTPHSLLAVLDPHGWWNLHRITLDGHVTNLAPVTEELGGALWKIGSRWFVPVGTGRYAVLRSGKLAVLDESERTVTDVPSTLELLGWSPTLAAIGSCVFGVGAGPLRDDAVIQVDLDTGHVTEFGTRSAKSVGKPLPSRDFIPRPEARFFPTADGESIPAYIYPPTNPHYRAPADERPPYVIHVHGGPTGRVYPVLDLDFTYFTSRGIGVVAVNYGGSTGYGRRYRERLREQWGVVDVEDCVAVAQALVDEGIADGERLAIRGGSAGGFTSAGSITTVNTYRAATVKFPIVDLYAWTGHGGETHDFESQYLHGLVGELPGTEDRYRERSPVNNSDSLAGPVLFLQGLEDEICPPAQADRFIAGLADSSIPHAYLTFDGEQHGFRKAETMITALEAELSFYGQVFGFDTPGVAKLDLRS